jgi:hypothetical protein
LAVTALAGCATTQQKAARLRLNDFRLRASEQSVRVTRPGSEVAVEQVSAVTDGDRVAVVVRVRNPGTRTVSDLPISVGTVGGSGKRTYFNDAPGLDYFQTHLPVVPAHGRLTWVYSTRRHPHPAARLFAEVGSRSLEPRDPLPHLQVLRVGGARRPAGLVHLTVVNHSSVPQYQLPVYAIVRRGGRYVAAGEGTVDELTAGGSSALRLALVGTPAGALELEAPPTIFT